MLLSGGFILEENDYESLYHAKPYKVYGVCTDKCDSSSCGDTYTAFLIYLDEAFRWSWVNVRDCTPYKKKKHKKKGCKQY